MTTADALQTSCAGLPTSRAEAVERGAVRYFNGAPCPAGHIADRYTLSGYCCTCQLKATRDQKAAAKLKRGLGR